MTGAVEHATGTPGGTATSGCDRLAGARTVVTGASSGIGRAIAVALAAEGATVLLTYRASADAADDAVREIRAAGGRAEAAQADLSTAEGCRDLVARARKRLGGLDVWVNNAGADVLTGEAAGWPWERKLDAIIDVDLRGTIACCHAAGRAMAAQAGGGTIVNMSWDHVSAGMAGENPELFSAVKGGVLSYSRSLARSLAPKVRVNVVSPGWIETRFGQEADEGFRESVARSTPLGRWGRPEDVAGAVVYLASPEAAFVTGQSINVNGGVVME
jgi:3-oxoacyl-[acyl-carrier protein] reductase